MNGYAVIVEQADGGGFGAGARTYPAAWPPGRATRACVADMREAVRFHLDGLREDGLAVPVPRAVGVLTINAA